MKAAVRAPGRGRGIKGLLVNRQLYLMLLIPLALLFVFKYAPMYGAQIAFRNYRPTAGFLGSQWVGFKYFTRFFNSPLFGKLMGNTLLLSLESLILSFPLPILLAFALTYVRSGRYGKVVQMVSYAPHFISVVVMVGILVQLFNVQYGVLNQALKALGFGSVDVLGKAQFFRGTYVLSGIWQNCGWNSIIYISALAAVDPQIHEACVVDGATKLQRIRYVDFPSILPTAVTLFILSFGSFMSNGFEKVYLLQNDLNLSVSEVIDTYVYKMGLSSASANFSYSTAIGLFQSLISFCLVVLVNRVSKAAVGESLW